MKYIFIFFTIFFSIKLKADTTKPHRVYVKPNAILTTLDGKESVRLGKGIYAIIKPYNSKGQYFIIYDKSGKTQYTVPGEQIVDIDRDIELLPNISAETIYPPPEKLKVTDKEAFLDTQFNLHLDNMQFSNVYTGFSTNNAVGTRFELRTLYSSTLPVHFGLSTNIETASWTANLIYDNGELPVKMKFKALSVGPHFQYYTYDNDGLAVSILGGFEFSPFYQITSEFGTDKYSATLIDLGVEVLWGRERGKWSVGSHYRRHNLTLKSASKTGMESIPEDIALNSFGLMLGYKYEWEL